MVPRTTKLWEDAPEAIRVEKNRVTLETENEETEKARKYLHCEYCGAKRGENCRPDVYDKDKAWRAEWDVHSCRHKRWAEAHDLERAMLEATFGSA